MKDIVPFVLNKFKKNKITEIDTHHKIDFICKILDISPNELDDIISDNPPVLRTVKGHCFESYFDELLILNGYNSIEVGGDTSIDRIVEGREIQLKTPYTAGRKGSVIQYKCHKTHGPKSEIESMDYYHSLEKFPDFFVGLISYSPQMILILEKKDLPLTYDNNYIMSPFSINLEETDGINAFQKLGLNIDTNLLLDLTPQDNEILPKTANKCGVNSEIIINTIINTNNFRIWDMSIKGFAREYCFLRESKKRKLLFNPPSITKRLRYDKSDFVVLDENYNYKFFQMKGVSINNCKFDIEDPIIATETQLTRGRVNDHPTQSRLYLKTDFDYLILAIDPLLSKLCNKDRDAVLKWEFYIIPTENLSSHHIFNNRLSSLQKFKYSELSEFKF